MRFRLLRRLGVAGLGLLSACVNLDESPTSATTPDNFYRTPAEILGGVAGVYAQFRLTGLWVYYDLNEITTDEMIVPTRGQDWYDNGQWLELHRQLWGPASASGVEDITGGYVAPFRGIARANLVLDAIEKSGIAHQDTVVAELRALRAYYYYQLMDLYGGVPVVTDAAIQARPRNTRAEVFQFIERELNEARVVLPVTRPAAELGRVTRGACDAILANMYLNAQVFTGTVTTAGLQLGPARWQDAVTAADRVLNAGVYSLET